MLEAIRIENLRSIKDSGFVKIAPLTILVGKNSSGKSTFLRSFPLLAQSVSKRLRGPVSWFDANSVDFGDYHTAKNRFTDNSIRFSFRFSAEEGDFFYMRSPWRFPPTFRRFRDLKGIKISLSLNEDENGTYIDDIVLSIDKQLHIRLNIEKRDSFVSFYINDEPISENAPKVKFSFRTDIGIVPSIFSTSERDYQSKLIETASDILCKLCDRRLKNTQQISDLLVYSRGYSRQALLDSIRRTSLASLKRSIQDWTIDSDQFMQIYKLYILSELDNILEIANSYIYNFFVACGYIAPARAEAMRYYRNQELQVDDVDSYGRNLQEFISSMSPKSSRYESFTRFTKSILGVKISVHNSTGNQSIFISKDDNEFNLADVGFGYSQILPVITKLWHTTQYTRTRYSDRTKAQRCVVMEQPELHLHPALQAKIADAFLVTLHEAAKHDVNLKIIVETHSPTIINRIGKRISEGTIPKDMVNVLIFDKADRITNVRETKFKDNGQLDNWPMGFFSPVNEPLIFD